MHKKDTNWSKVLLVGLKLGLTLCYMGTGIDFSEMHNDWILGYSSVFKVVFKVCNAIIAEFQDEVLETPANEDEWKLVARHFKQRWNLLHCMGVLD